MGPNYKESAAVVVACGLHVIRSLLSYLDLVTAISTCGLKTAIITADRDFLRDKQKRYVVNQTENIQL